MPHRQGLRPGERRVVSPSRRLAQPNIFPELMGADVGGIDITHGIGRDPRCRGAAVDSAKVGRIGDKGAQRTIDGAADHDATQLARLRSRRLIAACRLVAECGTDIKRIRWGQADIIENRPALSRWHPRYADAFAAYMKRGD